MTLSLAAAKGYIIEDDGSYTPKMKLSESAEKMTIPCLKKVWRIYDQDGKATADLAMAFGADDIDGPIDDTTSINSMAGAEDRTPSMSIDDMHRIVQAAGYRAVERDTFYNEI